MAAAPPDLDGAEWEQLQRECHPFPAYVDYIHGKETKQETQPRNATRHFQLRRDRALSVISAETAPSPCPTRRNPDNYTPILVPTQALPFQASSQPVRTLQNGQFGTPPDQALIRHSQTGFGSQELPHVFRRAPATLHMLKRDELLNPKFEGISRTWRREMNNTVHTCYTILEDVQRRYPDRIKARNYIVKISNTVSEKATELSIWETTERNIHKELPKVYEALRVRDKKPDSQPDHELATKYLHDTMKSWNESAKNYASRILKRMFEASERGYNPLAAIPRTEVRQTTGKARAPSSRA